MMDDNNPSDRENSMGNERSSFSNELSEQISDKIVLALNSTKTDIMTELGKLSTAIKLLESRVDSMDGACKLRHCQIDKDMGSVQTTITQFKKDEVETLRNQVRLSDAEFRKYLFWGVTTVIGLLLSGGGIFAIVARMLK